MSQVLISLSAPTSGEESIFDAVDPPGGFGTRITRTNDGGITVWKGLLGGQPLYVGADLDGEQYMSTSVRALLDHGCSLGDPWRYRGDIAEDFRGHVSPSTAIGLVDRSSVPQWISLERAMLEEGRPMTGSLLVHHLAEALSVFHDRRGLLLLSGGVDSCLIAAVAKREGLRLRSVTLFEGQDSEERIGAHRIAEECGLDHTEIELSLEELLVLLPRAMAIFEDPRPDVLTIGLVMATLAEVGGDELIVGGEPADIVFGMYRDPTDSLSRQQEAFDFGLQVAAERTTYTLSRCASAVGSIAVQPYASPTLVADAAAGLRPSMIASANGTRESKWVQYDAAIALASPLLVERFAEAKIGFPAAGRGALSQLAQRLVARADIKDGLGALFVLSRELFKLVVGEGILPQDIDCEALVSELAT